MSDVVGMDGKPVEGKKAPEDIKQMRTEQREDEAEHRRFMLLKLAVDIQNPSQVTADSTVQIAKTFNTFVTNKETRDEKGPQADPVPPVAS